MKTARVLFGAFLIVVTGLLIGARADSKPWVRRGVGNASGKARLISLNSLDPLKEAFQSDTGKIRLFALVSPT